MSAHARTPVLGMGDKESVGNLGTQREGVRDFVSPLLGKGRSKARRFDAHHRGFLLQES